MLILGISILFITTLNYVLISISSLSRRAKSIGVHKCSGAGTGTVFGMFMWETGIIILLSLFLMVFLMFNFREFVEDTTAAKLESLFAVERIWVPFGVTAVLFLIGGVLPGRIFSKIPVTQVFRDRNTMLCVLALGILLDGIYNLVGYLCRWKHIYLCYQSMSHTKMTPTRIEWERLAKKDAYGVPAALIIGGIVGILVSIFLK